MRHERHEYWALTEAQRLLLNASSAVRQAERLLTDANAVRTAVVKVADDLAEAAALAGASKRRLLEEQRESEQRSAA